MSRDRLSRIERIERLIAEPLLADVPLSRAELAELAALERDRAAMGRIEDMDAAGLDAFMAYQCSEHGAAERLDHLRQRSRSREEIAADRAMDIAIAAMDAGELDDFMDAMNSGSVGDHQWRP